jgi:signal transduction histidine kinase
MPERSHILIADDMRSQAEMFGKWLEPEGYNITMVHDGSSALEHIQKFLPDIALLDIEMPGLTGIEVCQKVKNDVNIPFLPVVLITALEDPRAKIAGVEAGADDFINKPPDPSELKARVRSLLRAKRLFDDLQTQNTQLAELNVQKNRFLGMAAHDLRNPLSAIMTYSGFLNEEASVVLNSEQKEFVETIHRSSEFMLSMVTDLLDFSQIETGKLELNLETVDLMAQVNRNVTLNRLLSDRKGIVVNVLACEDLPPLVLDPHKIEQVLSNLISNAIKYSHADTTVTVEVKKEHKLVIIAVKDQGQGIPAEEIASLFEPFETTSVQSTAGESSTGLGLVIVKQIVEGHGGKIEVESQVGAGSTFTVSLPIRQEDGGQTSEGDAMPELPSLKILVAEDNPVNQRIAVRMLEKFEHQVTLAENGEDAVYKVAAAPFDVVLMDVQMPKMDGLEATRQIREFNSTLAIIGLTGKDSEADVQEALDAGMNACVSKPINPREIFGLCAELI